MDAMKRQRDVAAALAVVPTGMLGIGRDRADVIRTAQSVGRTRNGEQLVLAGDRITAIADILGSFVGRAQDAECEAASRAGQFGAPLRIDDAASVDGNAHVAVATGSGDVGETEAFHEERALLVEEHRKALIDLHLKRIALDLAEVGVDRSIERDVRGNAELSAESRIRLAGNAVPALRCRAGFADWISGAWNHFDETPLIEPIERQVRM